MLHETVKAEKIDGDLTIALMKHENLSSIDELASLKEVTSFLSLQMPSLNNMAGLASLEKVQSLRIKGHSLENGFWNSDENQSYVYNLSNIDTLEIRNAITPTKKGYYPETFKKDFKGLENITSLDNLTISFSQISANTFSGFENLEFIKNLKVECKSLFCHLKHFNDLKSNIRIEKIYLELYEVPGFRVTNPSNSYYDPNQIIDFSRFTDITLEGQASFQIAGNYFNEHTDFKTPKNIRGIRVENTNLKNLDKLEPLTFNEDIYDKDNPEDENHSGQANFFIRDNPFLDDISKIFEKMQEKQKTKNKTIYLKEKKQYWITGNKNLCLKAYDDSNNEITYGNNLKDQTIKLVWGKKVDDTNSVWGDPANCYTDPKCIEIKAKNAYDLIINNNNPNCVANNNVAQNNDSCKNLTAANSKLYHTDSFSLKMNEYIYTLSRWL